MASDPNSLTFGVLALGGLGLVFVALRNVRTEVKTMVLESDDFRTAVANIADDRCRGRASTEDVAVLGAEVKLLKRIAKLPETTAIPRERLDA